MPIKIISRLSTDTPAIADLLKARERIAERLSQNADFQALQALDTTIGDLRATLARASSEAEDRTEEPEKPPLVGYSQAEGAHIIIRSFRRPFTVGELVESLSRYGIQVGGKDKSVNLSSTLSKDERFESIRYEGRACWWIKGLPMPESNTAGKSPAA